MESKLLAQFSVNFYQLLLQMKWLRWGAATSFYCIDAQFKCWDQMDQNSAEYLILVLTPETSSRFKGWVAGEWTRTTPSRCYSWEYAGALQPELRIAYTYPSSPIRSMLSTLDPAFPFLMWKSTFSPATWWQTHHQQIFTFLHIFWYLYFLYPYICIFVYIRILYIMAVSLAETQQAHRSG